MSHFPGRYPALLVLFILLGTATLAAQTTGPDGGSDPMTLDGYWTFYPGQLLDPGQIASASGARPQKVPEIWKTAADGRASHGHGTYYLRVERPGLRQPVMELPNIGSAHRLWVNGQLVSQGGQVGTGPESSRGGWRPGLSWLPESSTGVWELVLQVSNYEDISGGLPAAPLIGPAKAMTDFNRRELLVEAFFFGALLLIGLYHLGLFLFRVQDSSPLWFGLIAVVLAYRILVDNHHLLVQLWPDMPWIWALRSSYLTYSVTVVLFLEFMASVFSKHTWKPGKWIIQGLAAGYSLVALFLQPLIFTGLLTVFHLVTLLGSVQIFVTLFRALRAGEPGARVFLAGFGVFFLTVAHDIARIYIITPIPPLAPSGLIGFLLFQALVMARKFTATFTAAENFSAYLKRMNLSLNRFIPREVLSYLKKDSIMDISLGDHTEMEMTVLFADIRDFTTLSEKMTPRENFNFINSYLKRMGPIIRQHGGFVDKYLGDGIMALFPGDPHQALEAALDMRRELVRYNTDRGKAGYDPIRIGVGLHTGTLMVGTIGEEGRMDSTVISDTVNLAARLEGLTKLHQADILVSQAVVEAMPESERQGFRFIGDESVKGKSSMIGVWAI